MADRPAILVVDDEAGMRELLEIVFAPEYRIEARENVESAVAYLAANTVDVVITDLRMENDRTAGLRLLAWLKEHAPTTPSIMMTAHGSVDTAIEAMRSGAEDYILKPFSNDEIRMLVRRAIAQRDLVRENKALRTDQARHATVENMVGTSESIEQVRAMVRRVAVLPSTIAIYGESGTGKELIARSIHRLSDRRSKPFVAINCGGIPENLLESELFGHTRGAFTGAVAEKEGLFVAADGGTLFLDEVGEMPLPLQVKLLRVLDDHIVMPLGGTRSVKVDVRIVSATNRDLELLVRAGTFREDLFYRLNVIPLHVPPLRRRLDDIPLLAYYFIREHARAMNRPEPALSAAALKAIAEYRWPGNVRELRNAMERAVALSNGRVIDADELPLNAFPRDAAGAGAAMELPEDGVDLESITAEIEKNLIRQALERARYSQKKAAELLNLTPRSLRYRLQKYGMRED